MPKLYKLLLIMMYFPFVTSCVIVASLYVYCGVSLNVHRINTRQFLSSKRGVYYCHVSNEVGTISCGFNETYRPIGTVPIDRPTVPYRARHT